MGGGHGRGTVRAAPDGDSRGGRRGLLTPDGADEEGTLAALKMLRACLPDPKIKEHRGRIVHTTGDGLLSEFASVVDAVRCAVEVQREMAARNAAVPAERRIDFRIGVNLGDIIIDESDIFGDGVNVAARLEALAEPGGICVSRVVRDQVRDKLAIPFEDMGEQQVKNIADRPSILSETAASRALSDRPSIAVLPFNNVSGDPAQEYFVDGITEDILTALSKMALVSRHRPQFHIRLQRKIRRPKGGRPRPWGPLCPRG